MTIMDYERLWVGQFYWLNTGYEGILRKEIYAVERNTRRFNIDFKMTEEDYK